MQHARIISRATMHVQSTHSTLGRAESVAVQMSHRHTYAWRVAALHGKEAVVFFFVAPSHLHDQATVQAPKTPEHERQCVRIAADAYRTQRVACAAT